MKPRPRKLSDVEAVIQAIVLGGFMYRDQARRILRVLRRRGWRKVGGKAGRAKVCDGGGGE